MKKLILLFILVFSPYFPAQAEEDWYNIYTKLNLVGQGDFTWWGFTIYRAGLWSTDGDFSGFHQPVALHIEYLKNITSRKLVQTTADEWQRIGNVQPRTADRWLQQVKEIWPDVQPGDSITTIVMPNAETAFLVNGRFAGKITDPKFGPSFLSIWLHQHARHNELRNQLIGAKQPPVKQYSFKEWI